MAGGTSTALALLALGVIAAASPHMAAAQAVDAPIVTTPAAPPADQVTPEQASPEQASPEQAFPEQASPEQTSPGQAVAETAEADAAVAASPHVAAADEADAPIVTAAVPPPERAPREEASPEQAAAETPETAAAVASTEEAAIAEPSDAVRQVLGWVTASGDNEGLPFVVIDKLVAQVFVFDAQARLLGATPALLGSAAGDDSTPGIGDRELSAIAPDERTTPAGRFMAAFGPATGGRTVLWVDFNTAISLHPVVTANKKERRLSRLYSPSPDDNRITFGCINIAAAFYEHLVGPLFKDTRGVVYILPDTKALDEVFPTLHAQAPADHPTNEGTL